ncbi:MAG: alginate lyase family protein [Chloroflexota bacterium]
MPLRVHLTAALRRARLGGLALRELGAAQLAWYGIYRLSLVGGRYRRRPAPAPQDRSPGALRPLLDLPSAGDLARLLEPDERFGAPRAALLAEADEIAAGQARLFGGPAMPLRLAPVGELRHWTAYESGAVPAPGPELAEPADIKFTWEPARFGWVFTLGRAYRLTGDERFSEAFWRQAQRFLDANPPYRGPHWASAQEAALRLAAFTFAGQVFAGSPHSCPDRQSRLAQAIAEHARRIPPTLAYARAQNNNHLLSEAAGLYTTGLALPEHPQAAGWRARGWWLFNEGLQAQIAAGGAYAQHSANYHRLALQLAVWMDCLRRAAGDDWPPLSRRRLAEATRWLLALVDPLSGRVPNLGPNDGAYIFPLAGGGFHDYRPALQAAALAFLGGPVFPPGPWDEIGLWMGGRTVQPGAPASTRPAAEPDALPAEPGAPLVLRAAEGESWAYLRAAHFDSRPGHADQLHLDLWWRGANLAIDPGTYLYNTPPPWDNALRRAEVHNTVTVNQRDQMLAAGRFLYLERAQARRLAPGEAASWGFPADEPRLAGSQALAAVHDGYRRLGVEHARWVAPQPGGWQVLDALRPLPGLAHLGAPLTVTLHWLLPDWPFDLDRDGPGWTLALHAPVGLVRLTVAAAPAAAPLVSAPAVSLVRAGALLHGQGPAAPTWGWHSPTYGVRLPALALRLSLDQPPPLRLITLWRLTDR